MIAKAARTRLQTFPHDGLMFGAIDEGPLDGPVIIALLSVPHPRAFFAAMPRGQILRSWYMLLFQLPWLPEQLIKWGNARGDGGAARKLTSVMKLSPATATVTGKIRIPTPYIWSTDDAALGRAAARLTGRYVEGITS